MVSALAALLLTGPMASVGAAAPPNDDFAFAEVFYLDDPSPLSGTNVGATAEPGEPVHAGSVAAASVWWVFTSDVDGTVSLSTAGSDFDTVLAVYTGTSFTDLVTVAENDDSDGMTSAVEFAAEGGTTFHVAVDGYDGDTGTIQLAFAVEGAGPPLRGTIEVDKPVDFGVVPLGASAQRTISVRSVGDEPLDVWSVEVTERSFADGEYSIVSDAASGTSIPPGESRDIVLRFTPKTAYGGPPALVSHREGLGELGLLLRSDYYEDAVVVGRKIYAYALNTGGSGTIDYRAATSHVPVGSDDYVDGDERRGSTPLLGGEYYRIETLTRLGTFAYETALDLDDGADWQDRTVLKPVGSSTLLAMGAIDHVTFQRQADAALVILSSDPDEQEEKACPDCIPTSPAGTYVGLLGQATDDGQGGAVERWAGSDRYATAAAVSASTFPGGADVAFIATGANYPDALAGGPAGVRERGPILLSARDALPPVTITELERLQSQRIVVLGGTAAISDAVVAQLAAYAPDGVTRWAGGDRFATAARISAETFPDGAGIAFVATGENFPDALAGGPAGGLRDGPILLTGRDSLPAATVTELQRLEPHDIVVLGGAAVVSEDVATQLATLAAGDVIRWSGGDRYATAAAVSAATFPGGADIAFVATGANFPDALAGGPAGGMLVGPILLTSRDSLPSSTIAELQRLGVARIVVLGGDAVVAQAVLDGLHTYVQ